MARTKQIRVDLITDDVKLIVKALIRFRDEEKEKAATATDFRAKADAAVADVLSSELQGLLDKANGYPGM